MDGEVGGIDRVDISVGGMIISKCCKVEGMVGGLVEGGDWGVGWEYFGRTGGG